jgi:hypothetical protein
MSNEQYRTALDRRIKAGKVYLNNKQTQITGYFEFANAVVVLACGKGVILTEEDNLIMDGNGE